MDVRLPCIGYEGIEGRVIAIWWVRAQGHRYAISIEEDTFQMYFWILWRHLNGAWSYQVFLEMPESDLALWVSDLGQVERVACFEDSLMYMTMEREEDQGELVWLLHEKKEEGEVLEEEYQTTLVLWTPEQPSWVYTDVWMTLGR
jgi:hypothetical protein